MKFKLILFMILFGLLALGCGQKQVLSDQITFILDVYTGSVDISRDEGKNWKMADVGQELAENDQIRTGPDSFCDIIMPDRGIFRIADNSIVLLSNLKKQLEVINIKKGKILANITKKLAEDETFLVGTTTAVVSVRGTEFSVLTDGEKTVTAVKKGEVKVRKNISLNTTNLSEQELAGIIEIPVKQDENLEVDAGENKELEDSLNKQLAGVTDKAQILSVVKNATAEGVKKVSKVKDVDTLNKEFGDITSPERLKKIENETERYRQEIEKDKKVLEQNVESIKSKAGLKDIAGKKVSDEVTTAEQDIKSGEATKKASEIREKLAEKKKELSTDDARKEKLKNLMDKAKKKLGSN